MGIFEFDLGFPGQRRDRETGLWYNYLRDCYDPATGRYCQSDPIGLRGGLNTYEYVNSTPLSSTDIFGLASDGVDQWGKPKGPVGVPDVSAQAQQDLAKRLAQLLCPPSCWQIQADIEETAQEIRQRYFQMLNDPKDLYNQAYCSPSLGRRIGTWLGHGDQIEQKRRRLAKLIKQADAMNCPVNPQDRALLSVEPPGCPADR